MAADLKSCEVCDASLKNTKECAFGKDSPSECTAGFDLFWNATSWVCCKNAWNCVTCDDTKCLTCISNYKVVGTDCVVDTSSYTCTAGTCYITCATCTASTAKCSAAECVTCALASNKVLVATKPTSGTTWPTDGTCTIKTVCGAGFMGNKNTVADTAPFTLGTSAAPEICLPCGVADCATC